MTIERESVAAKARNWGAQALQFTAALAIVFLAKGAIAEPFYVPSGSMEPTLLIGDHILVNKLIFGLRMPDSLFGARPRSLESGQLAELLTAFGGAIMGNAAEYGDAKRTALQLRAAAESRALVDQAKGMLMQALGCSAEDALDRLRQISQERNLRVTDVARTIIDSRGARGARTTGGNGSARR